MWWEPSTEHEARLARAVEQLKSWFRERREEATPIAWGVGSAWEAGSEELAPFILLNSEYFSVFPAFRLYPLDFIKLFFSHVSFPEVGLPIYAMPVTPPRLSSRTFEEQMSLLEGLLEAFVPIREPIVSGSKGSTGTAGILVWDPAAQAHGLLTAGHVFPDGMGSQVDILRKLGWFYEWREHLGEVSHHIIPTGPAGWDAAVIRLAKALEPEREGVRVRRFVESFKSPERVVVQGAVSGFVSHAAVQGALTEIEFAKDGRSWANCWFMTPSGVLKGGDSGSAVFTRQDGRLLGIYVGSSHLVDVDMALSHYVQDALSLEINVLREWNISF
jgi:hypothetical protein